jgi:hypothetical protein
MSINSTAFYMIGSYLDGSLLAENTAFPSVSNYSDGRIITLITTAVLLTVIALTSLAGYMPAAIKRADVYSYEYLMDTLGNDASGGKGAFVPRPKTSKFGGTRTSGRELYTVSVV